MEHELDYIKEKARMIAKAKLAQVYTQEAIDEICRFLNELKLALEGGIDFESVEKRIESYAIQEPHVPLTPVPVMYNNLYEIMGYWSRIEGSHRIDLAIRENGKAWFSDYDMFNPSPRTEDSDFNGRARLVIEEDKQYLQIFERKIEIVSYDPQKRLWIRLDHKPQAIICFDNFSSTSLPLWPCQGIL